MEPLVVLLGPVASKALPALRQEVTAKVSFVQVPTESAEPGLDHMRHIELATVVVCRCWPFNASDAPNSRLIQSVGAGIDSYSPHSIPPNAFFCNVYEHEESIAEYVFMAATVLVRELFATDTEIRAGDWSKSALGSDPPRRTLRGMTLGIIGYGRIGRALLKPAKAFGMRVMAIQRQTSHQDDDHQPDFIGGPQHLESVLSEADVVVISAPLNEQTRGMIGAHELGLMKESSVLINVGRGSIVDEGDLFTALKQRTIAAAAIDVWYQYPEPRSNGSKSARRLPSRLPFHELDNVLMTPHNAGWTTDTIARRWKQVSANIDRISRGERPLNIVLSPRGNV